MMGLLALSVLTGLAISLCMVASMGRTSDLLAPAMIFGALLLFQYVFYPIQFELVHADELRRLLDDEQLIFAQALFLVGSVSLLLGLLAGTGSRRRGAPLFGSPNLTPEERLAAKKAMRVLVFISLGSLAYGSIKAGGLTGQINSEFGYLNEAYHFCVPATALYLLSVSGRSLTRKDLAICVFLMSPMLIRGLLVAKRGPTLIFVLGLALSWFLVSRKRPSMPALATGALATLFLVAGLFANRNAIWTGGEISFDVDPASSFATVNPGNDYIYGAAMANVAWELNAPNWGARYLITFFVRPIPVAALAHEIC